MEAGAGTFWALSDNGFGGLENSAGYNLRIYKIRPSFETAEDGPGTVEVLDFIELRDPDGFIDFAITNAFTSERVLTGADFDVESFQQAPDSTFWIGDEFGPFLLHLDQAGALLESPVRLPDIENAGQEIRAPQNPYSEEASAVRVLNALQRHARLNGSDAAVVFSPWYVMLDDDDPATFVDSRQDPPPGLDEASSEIFNYYRSGPGSTEPQAERRWRNAERVRFNIETKRNPRTDTDEKGNVFVEHTVGPEPFAEAVAGEIVENGLAGRAVVQSFDFSTLLVVHEQYPAIGTVALFGDFPKVGDAGDGANLQGQGGMNTPWLAGLFWPYRVTAQEQPFRAHGSGGFEGMAISPDGSALYPLLEKPLVGASEGELLIHAFDIESRAYTGEQFTYPLDPEAAAIGGASRPKPQKQFSTKANAPAPRRGVCLRRAEHVAEEPDEVGAAGCAGAAAQAVERVAGGGENAVFVGVALLPVRGVVVAAVQLEEAEGPKAVVRVAEHTVHRALKEKGALRARQVFFDRLEVEEAAERDVRIGSVGGEDVAQGKKERRLLRRAEKGLRVVGARGRRCFREAKGFLLRVRNGACGRRGRLGRFVR